MVNATFNNGVLKFNDVSKDDLIAIYNELRRDLADYNVKFSKPIACKLASPVTEDMIYNKRNILITRKGVGVSIQDAMTIATKVILAEGYDESVTDKTLIDAGITMLTMNLQFNEGSEFSASTSQATTTVIPRVLYKEFKIPSRSTGHITFLMKEGTGEHSISDNSEYLHSIGIKEYFPVYSTYSLLDYISLPVQDLSNDEIKFIYRKKIDEQCLRFILKNYFFKKEVFIL